MPELPPNTRKLIWLLSQAHDTGQIIRVRCGICGGGWRYYMPDDLRQLLGDVDVNQLYRRMCCDRCGRGEEMDVEAFSPVASERIKLRVRRLAEIRIRKIPIWRD